MESIVAVVGTLLGAALGGVLSYVTQRANYRREAQERLIAARRQAYVAWLTEAHGIYEAVKAAWSGNPAPSPEARWRGVRAISPSEAQAALESLRLVATDRAAAAAASLWAHLRHDVVAIDGAGTKVEFKEWRERYWKLRRGFLDAARLDAGLKPLDWRLAGVSTSPDKPPLARG